MDNQTDQHKQHCVLSFSRWDLYQIGIPKEQVDSLTDEDLETIIKDLRGVYRQAGYLEALQFYVKFHLVFKKEQEATSN